MSKKGLLKNLFQQYSVKGEEISKKINEIKESNNYTEEYAKQLIQGQKQILESSAQATKEKALAIIKDAAAELSKGAVTNFQDSSYQMKLSNALKLVELGAKNMKNNDIKTLLEPFASDYIAIAAFKGALTNAGKGFQDIESILPADTRGKSLKYLEGMEKGINQYIDANLEWDGLTGAGMSLYGLEESLNNLDDDLNYIAQIQ